MHLQAAEQYLHQVNTMLFELDLRILLYLLSKTMFELLYILQNWPFSPHCAIMRIFRWLCDRMRQEVNCAKSHQRTISEALFLTDSYANLYIYNKRNIQVIWWITRWCTRQQARLLSQITWIILTIIINVSVNSREWNLVVWMQNTSSYNNKINMSSFSWYKVLYL